MSKTTTIALLSVMIVCLLAVPVMAGNVPDELETRYNCLNGTITNGTVIVLCNMTGLPTIGNWTITLPVGDVKIAYVHWHRWGACWGNPTAEFWNDDDVYESIYFPYPGEDPDVYEDHGVWFTEYSPRNGNHHYYWKVNATSGDNIFNATGCYPTDGEFCGGRWFFAVIDNVTAEADQTHDGHWWHNTGYAKTESGNEQETWYYNASGDPINTAANYTLWTAQSHYGNSEPPIEFNDVEIGKIGSDRCGGGRDFSLYKFNVNSTLIEADGDQKVKWKYNNDAYYVNFGTLAEVLPKPDLVITDIEPNATTLRANTNYTINATVKNIGSADVTDTFNLCLSVNGSYYNKTSVTGGLDVGESKTVSFARPVNLTNGCHNFTVVADCDGDIAESDETNNETTEYYQVGYVLVVEGNGDFDDLVTESENGVFGDGNVSKVGTTYYIQNFTIENCAGCGISIKDTTDPFVIRNCTVHNCACESSTGDSAGICLDNVTEGTIGDPSNTNTIANNTDAGIRVKNSTHVDITDNTIRNNTQYGIYAYPRQLPVTSETCDDCNYINVTNNTVTKNADGVSLIAHNCTVKNNTITNNTQYGIYFYGNNSDITDCNNIRNNTDYGVKLYNSYNNDIYCNILADNNASNPGHQACDDGDNDWNSTDSGENYTGNFWNDWYSNSGYPSTYDIDCGSNEDKRPWGLYDFLTCASVDRWAFKWQITPAQFNSGSPIYPDTEFNDTEYDAIKADDDVFACNTTTANGYYAAHRFNFSINDSCTCTCINESALEMGVINVTWIGKGWHDTADNGTYLYIWNFTSTAYEELDSTNLGTKVTLTGETTSSISNYISPSGNVTILVKQKSAHTRAGAKSHICTDYVKVVIADP